MGTGTTNRPICGVEHTMGQISEPAKGRKSRTPSLFVSSGRVYHWTCSDLRLPTFVHMNWRGRDGGLHVWNASTWGHCILNGEIGRNALKQPHNEDISPTCSTRYFVLAAVSVSRRRACLHSALLPTASKNSVSGIASTLRDGGEQRWMMYSRHIAEFDFIDIELSCVRFRATITTILILIIIHTWPHKQCASTLLWSSHGGTLSFKSSSLYWYFIAFTLQRAAFPRLLISNTLLATQYIFSQITSSL